MSLFSDRLVAARNKINITQKALAEKLNITAVRLNYWEKGKREPDVDMIRKLSEALNVSPDFLIGTDFNNGNNLSTAEQQLISCFRSLNPEGQDKLLDLADDLISSGKYIKNNTSAHMA